MACFEPLIGVDKGWTEDGKRDFKVYPHGSVTTDGLSNRYRYVEIPCGHCIGCRKSQALEWSNRMLCESIYHKDNYFITLTYCSEYAYIVPSVDLEHGEYCERESLRKRDLQMFFKRLRSEMPNSKFRYYAVGEYGPRSGKGHFHIVLFCDFDKGEGFDLIPSGRSETGQQYYESKILESLWIHTDKRAKELGYPMKANKKAMEKGKDPNLLGWCSIEPANYYTMKYVGQYVQKKLGAYPNSVYYAQNITPPFSVSSRKPGIGYQYLLDHIEDMQYDELLIPQPQGVVSFMPSRYFRKKLEDFDSGLADELSEQRIKIADSRFRATMIKTTLDEDSYRKLQEDVRLTKNGKRDKI